MAGGDTLLIAAGSYAMGLGAPGAEACSSDGPWECFMAALPGGPSAARPTRLLGQGWDAGCSSPPELWGTQRADRLLNLAGSSHVQVACLELTDHSGCVEFHTGGLACERDQFPYGDWAATGLYAADSADVLLQDLNIHGLAHTGILAGRLTDWTLERVRLVANGLVGWDGDLPNENNPGDDANHGTLRFRHWTVEWNGCAETWPGQQPTGCWAQEAGGYGDGIGTGETVGTWIIEDSRIRFNSSDGLDLLYARTGSSITVRRTLAEGNAGNQLKSAGPATFENNVIVGNCGFFSGKPFTFLVDHCRAAGNALSLDLRPGDQVTVTNNTLLSEGDCLLVAGCNSGACTGSEVVTLRNNILLGAADFLQPDERSCLAWAEGMPASPFDATHNLIDGVKDDACPGPLNLCATAPGLASSAIDGVDAHLLPGSAAIDAALPAAAPPTDFDNLPRDATPDMGAYEWRAP